MQATLPYQQAALYIGTKDLSCIVRCLQCALLRLGFVCIVPAPMSLRHQHLPEDFMAVCGTPLVGGLVFDTHSDSEFCLSTCLASTREVQLHLGLSSYIVLTLGSRLFSSFNCRHSPDILTRARRAYSLRSTGLAERAFLGDSRRYISAQIGLVS